MPSHVPQHENWDGHPVDCGDAWVLTKGDKIARCGLVTHPFGWELRLITTDACAHRCAGRATKVLSTHEQWKTAMIEKSWPRFPNPLSVKRGPGRCAGTSCSAD